MVDPDGILSHCTVAQLSLAIWRLHLSTLYLPGYQPCTCLSAYCPNVLLPLLLFQMIFFCSIVIQHQTIGPFLHCLLGLRIVQFVRCCLRNYVWVVRVVELFLVEGNQLDGVQCWLHLLALSCLITPLSLISIDLCQLSGIALSTCWSMLMFLPLQYGQPDPWCSWPRPLCISFPCLCPFVPCPLFPVLVWFPIVVHLDLFRCCSFLYWVPIAVFMNDGSSADAMSLNRIMAFCRFSLVVGFMMTFDFTRHQFWYLDALK